MSRIAPSIATLRILDANINRASEGLRVVEDYLRLGLNDRYLTELSKNLRHDLSRQIASIIPSLRAAARDTQNDVGTSVETASEYDRCDEAAVATANIKRVQQSLRCLEEFAKLVDPEQARTIESLRYRSYSLEKAFVINADSRQRMANRSLYVLVDGCRSISEFMNLVSDLVSAGVHIIQLREKTLEDRELIERARLLREAVQNSNTLIIMNDRPDLALVTQADGVHVGQEDLSVKDARQIVGPDALVGVSTHSIEQARQAVLDGANYIGVGPTFNSETKQFTTFPGLDFVRQVSQEITLPTFAIGGIDLENLNRVLNMGATRIAVSHAVTVADNPARAARALLEQLATRGQTVAMESEVL